MRMQFVPLALALLAVPVLANDWPQWRGPERNGISKETGLLPKWPDTGPKLLWKAADLGGGYSTPAIANGRIFLMSSDSAVKDEYVIALDEKMGSVVWKTKVGTVGVNRGPQYPGPRSTPSVDGERIYALASGGELVCLDKDGNIVWQKNLLTDFAGKMGNWAYSESVLIDGDVLVCTPGGSTATIAALNKNDGAVIWKSAVPGGDAAAYASPIAATVDNVKQYIQFLQRGIVGVDAKTGKFLWRYKETANGTANIPTPVVSRGQMVSATGYGTGAGLAKLSADQATPVWRLPQMVNRIGGFVVVGDHVYGTGSNSLMCVDFKTGKIVWQERSVGAGAVCFADGRLYVRGEGGAVALVEATPVAYREHGRFSQPERSKRPAWPYPVVANGRLFLRDQEIVLCYDVSAAR